MKNELGYTLKAFRTRNFSSKKVEIEMFFFFFFGWQIK